MATYPLATLGPTITSAGISIPSYNDIYQSLIAIYQNIYGADIYLSPDSQDAQFLAALATAFNDCNMGAVSVYNSFSPLYAQGVTLSSLVKINGLTRNVPTNSTAVGNVVGQAYATITNGVVADVNRNLWNLPASVTIPSSGSIAVTVTAQQAGDIVAPAGTINSINTPQFGWQSFVSTSDATPGAPVETDAALRQRQAASVANPSQSIKAGIYAAIGNIPGVTQWDVYENDTGNTDVNGVPAHTFCVIVNGGTTTAIANAIAARKPPGIQTFGNTTVTVTDSYGNNSTINYSTLAFTQIYVSVQVSAEAAFSLATQTAIAQALQTYINSLSIGATVFYSDLMAVASLFGTPAGQTFSIFTLTVGTAPNPTGTGNVAIAYNAVANVAALTNITVAVG